MPAAGKYSCGWKWTDDGIVYEIEVPFDAQADLILKECPVRVLYNGKETGLERENGAFFLQAGKYEIKTGVEAVS